MEGIVTSPKENSGSAGAQNIKVVQSNQATSNDSSVLHANSLVDAERGITTLTENLEGVDAPNIKLGQNVQTSQNDSLVLSANSVINMKEVIANHTEVSDDVSVENIEVSQNNETFQKDSSVLNVDSVKNPVIDTAEGITTHRVNYDDVSTQNIEHNQTFPKNSSVLNVNSLDDMEGIMTNHTENSSIVDAQGVEDNQNNLTFPEDSSVLNVNYVTNSIINTDKRLSNVGKQNNKHSENNQTSPNDLPVLPLNNMEEITTKHTENNSANAENTKDFQNNQTFQKNSSVSSANSSNKTTNGNNTVTVVTALRPLCADYRSDSDSESIDSESDSSTMSAYSTTDSSSEDEEDSSDDSSDSNINENEKKREKKKLTRDLSLSDLPPIEDLKISVSENECVEIGKISSIVDTLVVVESYKGSAALDLDTVLFLDQGKRTLGKVFDILGPITEPVYAIRFNSQEQIKNLNIEKNLKVYYAPKTQHTTFVFMSEVLKNKGSDASWKDNIEAPPEFQDFSDDEEERIHRNKQARGTVGENQNPKESNKSMKRPYSKLNHSSEAFQTSGFRNPNFCWQRRPNFQRNPSQAVPPPNVYDPNQTYPYNVPPYPPANAVPNPPRVCLPSRFAAPPFPVFGNYPLFNQNQNFQHPFYQQRAHGYPCQTWARPTMPMPMLRYQLPPPPPPPPPPSADQVKSQGHQQS